MKQWMRLMLVAWLDGRWGQDGVRDLSGLL